MTKAEFYIFVVTTNLGIKMLQFTETLIIYTRFKSLEHDEFKYV
jgi:phage regulator Rha-like protein